jgi:hypothetical protein
MEARGDGLRDIKDRRNAVLVSQITPGVALGRFGAVRPDIASPSNRNLSAPNLATATQRPYVHSWVDPMRTKVLVFWTSDLRGMLTPNRPDRSRVARDRRRCAVAGGFAGHLLRGGFIKNAAKENLIEGIKRVKRKCSSRIVLGHAAAAPLVEDRPLLGILE